MCAQGQARGDVIGINGLRFSQDRQLNLKVRQTFDLLLEQRKRAASWQYLNLPERVAESAKLSSEIVFEPGISINLGFA